MKSFIPPPKTPPPAAVPTPPLEKGFFPPPLGLRPNALVAACTLLSHQNNHYPRQPENPLLPQLDRLSVPSQVPDCLEHIYCQALIPLLYHPPTEPVRHNRASSQTSRGYSKTEQKSANWSQGFGLARKPGLPLPPFLLSPNLCPDSTKRRPEKLAVVPTLRGREGLRAVLSHFPTGFHCAIELL